MVYLQNGKGNILVLLLLACIGSPLWDTHLGLGYTNCLLEVTLMGPGGPGAFLSSPRVVGEDIMGDVGLFLAVQSALSDGRRVRRGLVSLL